MISILWRFFLSFLIGSIPFAKVAMLGTGIDIMKAGSGNPGFNNVLRVSSRWRAAITLIGDLSKGYVALLLLCPGEPTAAGCWAIGIAAVMGHCWSPLVGFNGGKGVATTAGVLLYLEPQITMLGLILYPLLRVLGRRMHWRQEGAISSLITMFVISTLVFGLDGLESGVFAYVAFGIITLRHAPNLREMRGF